MTEKVVIELPEDIIQQVRTVAAHTQRSFDEVSGGLDPPGRSRAGYGIVAGR